MAQNRLEKAFELFDGYNKNDPTHLVWKDEYFPSEYFYAIQLYNWVKKLDPNASEALLLASRSQHIGRWEIPRDTYLQNKAGYLNWRSNLAQHHAKKAGDLLVEAGYTGPEIDEVKQIILKQKIKSNSDAQTIENALCLVFLEFQYEDFIKKHDDAKLIRILQKTWGKMSDPGREEALKLSYSDKGLALIKQALGQ